MLLAKSSDLGLVYGLSVVADGGNFLVRLNYQQSDGLGVSSAEVSVPLSDLSDGAWHSLILTVGQGRAFFYIDNQLVDSR